MRLTTIILLSSLLTLTLNLIYHHSLLVAFLNSLTLGLSIHFIQRFLNLKLSAFNIFLTTFLALMPLFHYKPANNFFSLLPLLSLGILYLYTQFQKKLILIVWMLFLVLGMLYSNDIIKYPFKVQDHQLIFSSQEINNNLTKHQQDALYIPYRARQIVYSHLIYLYASLTSFFNFLSLKNLSDILLIANLYPLFTGIIYILKQNTKLTYPCIAAFLISIVTIGIDRSTDKYQSWYLLGPIFVLLIMLGAQRISKKLYLILWVLSFFIFISPKL